jgi:hypothetical protein
MYAVCAVRGTRNTVHVILLRPSVRARGRIRVERKKKNPGKRIAQRETNGIIFVARACACPVRLARAAAAPYLRFAQTYDAYECVPPVVNDIAIHRTALYRDGSY